MQTLAKTYRTVVMKYLIITNYQNTSHTVTQRNKKCKNCQIICWGGNYKTRRGGEGKLMQHGTGGMFSSSLLSVTDYNNN